MFSNYLLGLKQTLEITKLVTRGENLLNDRQIDKSKQFAIDLSEDNKIIKEMDATFIEFIIENEFEYEDYDKEAEESEKLFN